MPFLPLRLGFQSDAGAEYRTTRVPLRRKLSNLNHVVSPSKLRGHHSPRSDVFAHRVWPAMPAMLEVPESVLQGAGYTARRVEVSVRLSNRQGTCLLKRCTHATRKPEIPRQTRRANILLGQLSFWNDQRENAPSFSRRQNYRLAQRKGAVAQF